MDKITIYVALAVLLSAAIFGVTLGVMEGVEQRGEPEMEKWETQEEADARVEKALGLTPSEDATDLLQCPDLALYEEYSGPNPDLEYIIYLEGEKYIEDLSEAFEEMIGKLPSEYVWLSFKEDGVWVDYSVDYENPVASEWAISILLVDWMSEPLTRTDLAEIYGLIQDFARAEQLAFSAPESVPDAANRGNRLKEIFDEYSYSIEFSLRADEGKPFKGRELHDVAIGLGLKWNGKEYHWLNPDKEGGLYFFSVENEDGGFVPEEMAEESYTTGSLRFYFYLPYVARPTEIFENMCTAAQYFQQRLGGQFFYGDEILDEEDFAEMYAAIQVIVAEMEELGFKPGSNNALWLF